MRPLKKKKLNNYNSVEEEDTNSKLLAHNLYEHLYFKKENVRTCKTFMIKCI